MNSSVPDLRIRSLRDDAPRQAGRYVLYWMTSARRLSWNFALDRAIDWATRLDRPLLIFEALRVGYPWASARHHQVVIDGMADQQEGCLRHAVGYLPYIEPEDGAGRGLLAALASEAACVVTDDSPAFFLPRLLEAGRVAVGCRLEAVDGNGLLPLAASGRSFSAAYHFRRYLHKELPRHLPDRPQADALAGLALPTLTDLPSGLSERWPEARLERDASGRARHPGFEELPIDHGVGPTDWIGGERAARARLDTFLSTGLHRYADDRNQPGADITSRLSPALHYGHLSTHEIFDGLVRQERWTPNRLTPPDNGRRAGWWGMSESAEAFVDQLVTWRELGYGFCRYEPGYRHYDTLPQWARDTLEVHASDPRPWCYDLDDFDAARTHDELWNAAQRQLVEEGVVHNYLRMLWGKKILEWSAHPREALDVMVELNNRYALDGRDPNSWSGIMWVMGRFDRGWPERAVFGKVRSMSSESTRRKVDVSAYLERWGGQASLL